VTLVTVVLFLGCIRVNVDIMIVRLLLALNVCSSVISFLENVSSAVIVQLMMIFGE
jgi:hypothetical protein